MALLGGAAATWPLAAPAQQTERMRRIGVLTNLTAEDPESSRRVLALQQGLQELGWIIGRNVQIEYRWAAGEDSRVRKHAAELVALAPDVILASGSSTMRHVREITREVPTVFVNVTDPVSGGFVASLARPGGNVTGFMLVEYGTSGKWLQLLKEIAPSVRSVAVIQDVTAASGTGQFAAIQSVAPSLDVELTPVDVRDAHEIERALTTFAGKSNAGLIIVTSAVAVVHRERIITLAAKHRMPAVYPFLSFTTSGGLLSYGPDSVDPYRRAAGYIDRILKGEKPADLPVQFPTKYELTINLRTAKALGLEVPPTLLARADEVIE